MYKRTLEQKITDIFTNNNSKASNVWACDWSQEIVVTSTGKIKNIIVDNVLKEDKKILRQQTINTK
jgi:hypothetical protein